MEKLLTQDIHNVVKKSFTIQESDHFDYYSDIIYEHYPKDKRIFEKFKGSISYFIDWHLSKSKSDESCVPLVDHGILLSFNIGYYNRLMQIIELIEKQVVIRNQFLELERKLPESIREKLCKIPYNDFDNDDLNERAKLIKCELVQLEIKQEFEKLKDELERRKKADKQTKLPPFDKLFKPEYRAHVPCEVIRLLGPGEADAWTYKDDKKDWIYEKPESAIMIPFYSLIQMGYIEIPARQKNKFIEVWLQEFGVKYKHKTFDESPKDYKSNEYFTEYLNKLKK